LLIQRADADFVLPGDVDTKECDLIVKGVVGGNQRGWVYQGGDVFKSDKSVEAPWSRADLEIAASVSGQALTFTCLPPGSGQRAGIDRDRDRLLDGEDSVPTIPFRPRSSSDCGIASSSPAQSAGDALFLLVLGMVARRVAWGRRRRS